MIPKTYVSADEMTRDSFLLARKIWDSGFRPDILVALWRGGSPVGIAVQEFLHAKGLDCRHTVVQCSSYTGIETAGPPVIENMDWLLQRLTPDSRVLVVDDIHDTGRTAQVIRTALGHITPHLVFATLYFKPNRNQSCRQPDVYVRETDRWLVFPHELVDLTPEEIHAKDPYVHHLLFDS